MWVLVLSVLCFGCYDHSLHLNCFPADSRFPAQTTDREYHRYHLSASVVMVRCELLALFLASFLAAGFLASACHREN